MNKFDRKSNETFDEYCHRISSVVKFNEDLTWVEVSQIINEEFNLDYSESYYRKKEKNYTDIHKILNSSNDNNIEYLKIAKERVKLSDERNQINAILRRLAREDTIKEIAHNAIDKLSTNKQLVYQKPNIQKNIEKEGLLLLSDWHYGLEIDNNFNSYNPDIVKYRLNQLLKKVIDKCNLLNISTLHIANLGDMISGNIHLPLRINSRIDIITQIIEVSELLSEFINELSNRYDITYYSVIDNHSRLDANKKDSIQLESLCRITDWYLKGRLPQINMNEELFGQDICIATILGYKIAFVHGHKDNQSSIIRKLNTFTHEYFDLICSAHYHHFSANEECGTFMIANSSLMGTDDNAYNLRLHAKPSQTLIEISETNVVEGIYKLNLD